MLGTSAFSARTEISVTSQSKGAAYNDLVAELLKQGQ
jgi:hypothetical protein